MEAAEAKMVQDPLDQNALDSLMQAQSTFEAVGGMTQDRLVAQVEYVYRLSVGRIVYVKNSHGQSLTMLHHSKYVM